MAAQNLPTGTTTFIGREAELARIGDLLTAPECRLLTLTGPGGIGKTRLGLEIARRLSNDDTSASAFLHGVFFAPMQPLTSTEFMIPTIASSLKITFFDDRDPRAQLLDYLRGKNLLLVIDNFEHLIDGVDLLADILEHAPAVKMLVTSRERLRLREEWVMDILGLPFPHQSEMETVNDFTAIQLFIENARRAGYDPHEADIEAITRICRSVEGIPLAIELAAAWVRVLPCEVIAREIEVNLDILTTNLRNVPENHRSMHAVFEHSWALLSDEEQSVFRRLSVFRGGFRREAAQAVTGANLAILAALMDKSLLRMDSDGRYSLQELLRQYAQYQFDLSPDPEMTRDAHCTYYAEFLAARMPVLQGADQIRALDEIEIELDNVRVCWRHAVMHGKHDEIARCHDALARFYDMRSRLQEGDEAFGMAVNHAGDMDSVLLGRLLMHRDVFLHERDETRGREMLHRAAALLPRIEDYPPATVRLFGEFVDEFGGYEAVQHIYQDQLAAMKNRGDAWGAAKALMSMGETAGIAERYTEAQQYFQESLGAFQKLGDRWMASWILSNLGMIAMLLHNHSEARQYFLEQLTVSREIGSISGIAFGLANMGFVAHALGEMENCRRYFDESLKLSLELQYVFVIEIVLFGTAVCLMAKARDIEQAVEVLAMPTARFHRPGGGSIDRIFQRFETLSASLPPDQYAAARERGQRSDLATIAAIVRTYLTTTDHRQAVDDVDATAHLSASDRPLIEPLTEREMEVLLLIAEGLNTRETAERLYLSVETVRWYLKQIYGKLDAHSRYEAVVRAKELQLFS